MNVCILFIDPKLVAFLQHKSKLPVNSDIHLTPDDAMSSDILDVMSTTASLNVLGECRQETILKVNERGIHDFTTTSDKINNGEVQSENMEIDSSEKMDIEPSEVDPYKEFDIKRDFVNMNEIEKEKLSWMKEVPEVRLKEVNYF